MTDLLALTEQLCAVPSVSGDEAALADAVLEVAARPLGRRRTAARRRAEQFPWAETVDRMLAVHAGEAAVSKVG